MLDIRKIEAGKIELYLDLLDANSLILQAVESLTSYASEHEVSLVTNLSKFPPVKLDRDRFTQIITNLISNAVKFSPAGASVEVRTAVLNEAIQFSVIDQGEGISKPNQKKLFKLFQQVESGDSRPKEGTGLGLAICKALVEQHGGTIVWTVKSGKEPDVLVYYSLV